MRSSCSATSSTRSATDEAIGDAVAEQIRGGQHVVQRDNRWIRPEVVEFGRSRLQELECIVRLCAPEEGGPEFRCSACHRDAVAGRPIQLDRPPRECLGLLEMGPGGGRFARPLEHLALLGWIGGHRQGLLEERDGLVVGAQGHALGRRPPVARCAPARPARRPRPLAPHWHARRGSGRPARPRARRCRATRSSVRRRDGELLRSCAGQRVVGDLADERLDERVLAALRRAGIDSTGRAARAGRGRAGAARGRSERSRTPPRAPASVKLWPSTAASWTSAAVGRVEGVETRRDERGQRLGHGQVGQVADRARRRRLARPGGPRPGACGPSRPRTAGCRRREQRSRRRPRRAGPARARPAARASLAREAARGRAR